MKQLCIGLLAATAVFAVACGSNGSASEPTSAVLPASTVPPTTTPSPVPPTATPLVLPNPTYARPTVARPTSVADRLPALSYDLLNTRPAPETLVLASNGTPIDGDQVIEAWTEFLGDTELLSHKLESLAVFCSDGTGLLKAVIPDAPEFGGYLDTPFAWEITRNAGNTRASAALNMTFDPPLDRELRLVLGAGGSGSGQSAIDLSSWKPSLFGIAEGRIHHDIQNSVDGIEDRGPNPSGLPGRLSDAVETSRCKG